MRKIKYILLFPLLIGSCTMFSSGKGQMVYHWERENTGVEKFSRDHTQCIKSSKDFRWLPDFKSWFVSEEAKLDVRADWNADKGIWASYVPYPGAQPLVINFLRNDSDANPRRYRICMEKKGYWHRNSHIPSITNLNMYNPRSRNFYTPYKLGYQ